VTQITITDADLAALVQAAKATLAKFDALADQIMHAADNLTIAIPLIQADVKGVSDTITAAITPILADVKEAADAIAAFKIKVF
jgi:hypothetical protein